MATKKSIYSKTVTNLLNALGHKLVQSILLSNKQQPHVTRLCQQKLLSGYDELNIIIIEKKIHD